jgi:hypothetical protein
MAFVDCPAKLRNNGRDAMENPFLFLFGKPMRQIAKCLSIKEVTFVTAIHIIKKTIDYD